MRGIPLLIVFCLLGLSSCAHVTSSYSPVCASFTVPFSGKPVEILNHSPERAVIRLGVIIVSGNNFTSDCDLNEEAIKIARMHGGDCLVLEKAGSEARTYYSPGYSTYQANSSTNAYGQTNFNGYGNAYSNGYNSYGTYQGTGYGNYQAGSAYTASGYSIGPSINTYYYPWKIFDLCAYRPSRFGFRYKENANTGIISGFHLNSDAEAAGMKIGDEVIGVNGCDIRDLAKMNSTVMVIQPEDKVVIAVRRNGKKHDFEITAIPNR